MEIPEKKEQLLAFQKDLEYFIKEIELYIAHK